MQHKTTWALSTGIIKGNYMTCMFILISAKSHVSAKDFFDRRLWEIAVNIFIPPNKITEPITAFWSACYRLCVCASGSWITDILMCFTLISVSCLHFGQNNGKFSSTVSSRNLIRVLLLQTGHSSHFIFKTLASFHYIVQPAIYPELLFSRITFCTIYHERF